MLCLPPHTSHASLPLDCGIFKLLKSEWTNVCHILFQNNPGKIITRFNFNSLFSQAWLRAVNPANIIGGFKRGGVCPYDPTAVCITGDVQTQSPPGYSTGGSGAGGNQSSNLVELGGGSEGESLGGSDRTGVSGTHQ